MVGFFHSKFIFDGKKGNYKESDYSNPINEYGKQKLEIEKFIEKIKQAELKLNVLLLFGNNEGTIIGLTKTIYNEKLQMISE